MSGKCKLWFAPAVCVAAASAILSTRGDTYTVNAGETQTYDSITNTTRFKKSGDGTLVLTGTNSLTTITVSAGTLNIHGGTTTFGDANAKSADGNGLFWGLSHVTIDGGATVTATAGTYVMQIGGLFTVSNATFDATAIGGHVMNGFTSGSSINYSRIIIGEGGVFKTKILRPVGSRSGTDATKENFSVDLNAGGNLYVNQFWEDNGSRYARINFNGGVLHAISGSNNELFNNATANLTWTQDMVTPTVLAGGAYIDNAIVTAIYPAFKSGVAEGETDGGVHHCGNTVLYWRSKNCTYNGGTWLESNGGGNFAVSPTYGDSVFGAVPATPETNIWVTGSNHILFNESGTFTTHSNRTVFIKDGKGFRVAAQGGAKLVIGGEIKGEITEGNDYPVGTFLESRLDWAGTQVLDPGEGRTNDVGRLIVNGHLEIASGVTRLSSSQKNATGSSAPLYVIGTSSGYNETKGNLTISGGELYIPQSSRYLEVSRYAQVNVVGGKFNAPSAEFLLGLATGGVAGLPDPGATLSVSNGGEFAVNIFRLGQGASQPTFVNLGKGGTIRANLLSCEFANNQNVTFNFDGGRFQSNASNDGYSTLFNSISNEKWAGVKFYVRKGGAILDSSNGKHCWWARPLLCGVEEGETDGGLTVIVRPDKAVVLCNGAVSTYNGPTRVTTTGATGHFQCRVANALPATTTLQIGPGVTAGFSSTWSSGNDLDQTVARVEGVGSVAYDSKLVVTNGIAAVFDGEYGTLSFGHPSSLAGDYTIVGDTNGCGCVKFNSQQDVSNLTLKFANVEALDAHARSNHYKIVDAPNGITNTFALAADWPNNWIVKYASDGKSVYVYRQNGAQIIVR